MQISIMKKELIEYASLTSYLMLQIVLRRSCSLAGYIFVPPEFLVAHGHEPFPSSRKVSERFVFWAWKRCGRLRYSLVSG